MRRPFAIAVAPNGARRSRDDHPALPIIPDEIARAAAGALEAGAAMIHLHVRDAAGRHVIDADRHRAAEAAVRAAVGDRIVVQATTEAVGRYTPAEQIALVEALRPESVSLALRELLPEGGERPGARLVERLEVWGTLWQLILYDPADFARMEALQARGVLPDGPLAILPVMGRYSGQGAEPSEFDGYLAAGIARHAFMLCAFGPGEARFMGRAALAGGHARVGFENNLALPDGRRAGDNADLLRAASAAAAPSGRPAASADDLRRLWRVPAAVASACETTT